MHFEEDDTRTSDEDPEFTGATATDDDVDDEFLSDDLPLSDDADALSDDDEDESGLTADL